ncbi:MAG: hypothetical protein HYX68_29805 [Planctomycetes bacterium]|nr:hypothetical protein [Planctomycetota bacterium]
MIATKIETTVQDDGELHLTQLPCRKGDRVEAIVLILTESADLAEEERKREEARRRFQERADASTFCSTGPYPSRDELHERP